MQGKRGRSARNIFDPLRKIFFLVAPNIVGGFPCHIGYQRGTGIVRLIAVVTELSRIDLIDLIIGLVGNGFESHTVGPALENKVGDAVKLRVLDSIRLVCRPIRALRISRIRELAAKRIVSE